MVPTRNTLARLGLTVGMMIGLTAVTACGEAPSPGSVMEDAGLSSEPVEPLSDDEAAWIETYAELNDLTLDQARVRSEQEGIIGEYLYTINDKVEAGLTDLWIDHTAKGLVLHVRTDDAEILRDLGELANQVGFELKIEGDTPIAAERTAYVASLHDELVEAIPELAGYYVDDTTGELMLDLVDENLPEGVAGFAGSSALKERAAKAAEELTGLPTRVASISPSWPGDHWPD